MDCADSSPAAGYLRNTICRCDTAPLSDIWGDAHNEEKNSSLCGEAQRTSATISNTEKVPGYDNSIKDAWGHELNYSVAQNGDVILSSFGKDNEPGGSSDNADMVGVFTTRALNGKWSDELVEWKLHPLTGNK